MELSFVSLFIRAVTALAIMPIPTGLALKATIALMIAAASAHDPFHIIITTPIFVDIAFGIMLSLPFVAAVGVWESVGEAVDFMRGQSSMQAYDANVMTGVSGGIMRQVIIVILIVSGGLTSFMAQLFATFGQQLSIMEGAKIGLIGALTTFGEMTSIILPIALISFGIELTVAFFSRLFNMQHMTELLHIRSIILVCISLFNIASYG